MLRVVLDVLLPVVLRMVAVVERRRLLHVEFTHVEAQQAGVVDVQLSAAGAGGGGGRMVNTAIVSWENTDHLVQCLNYGKQLRTFSRRPLN